MEDWVRLNFEIDTFNENQVIVFEFNDNVINLSLDAFLSLVGGLSKPPTLLTLKNIDEDDEKGWHQYFEAWKEQGILN